MKRVMEISEPFDMTGVRILEPQHSDLRTGCKTLSIIPGGQSGAKAAAIQTLAQIPGTFVVREASELRRVHRRFCPANRRLNSNEHSAMLLCSGHV
jgi:hypothetical protein